MFTVNYTGESHWPSRNGEFAQSFCICFYVVMHMHYAWQRNRLCNCWKSGGVHETPSLDVSTEKCGVATAKRRPYSMTLWTGFHIQWREAWGGFVWTRRTPGLAPLFFFRLYGPSYWQRTRRSTMMTMKEICVGTRAELWINGMICTTVAWNALHKVILKQTLNYSWNWKHKCNVMFVCLR